MSLYKVTAELSAIDAAYIAGLIDGEGTVTLCRKHKNENRQLSVTISNTERELLDYVLTKLVVGKITKKKTAQSHHTPSLTYAIYNRQALSLLKQITPYLRTYKRHRAEYILQHYLNVTPRNGKYSKELLNARKQFEEKVLNILPAKKTTK
ncbi:LAGLIDADG family homing endonuclease [Methylophaga sulfidovorans]|uniref:LAGLIDADG-like domain-containing protein n=1 Tax=Methylophaga sulfidovorans TaxID=45496 RepID=A0A1I3VSM4_9GAMM|nr:LAGLIDADG family homing endonuclease [Methylophaga sulfidovorans]SFJ97287.1 LAGLIDADG-like domain-containing protein [Methylophaga sulfidovorans]